MADLKISQLPSLAVLAGTEVFPVEIGGVTYQVSVSTFSPADTQLTYAANLTWDLSANPLAYVVLTGPITISVINGRPGSSYRLGIIQGGTGNNAVTLKGAIILDGPVSWNTVAGGVNLVTIDYLAYAPPITFNPGDVQTDFALTNGNLTATVKAGAVVADRIARAINPQSTGRFYFEATHGAIGLVGSNQIGLSSAVQSLSDFLGSSGNTSIGWADNGAVWRGGTTIATIASYVNGSQLGVAVDLVNNKIWFRVAAGNWNNDILANQNPATNTGGLDISPIAANPLMAAFQAHSVGDALTMNFGAVSFAQAVPSGFAAIPGASRYAMVA